MSKISLLDRVLQQQECVGCKRLFLTSNACRQRNLEAEMHQAIDAQRGTSPSSLPAGVTAPRSIDTLRKTFR
jgi:hypothetical protein